MLQLQHISKAYVTNAFTQVALDDVSLAFRDNEFVSILGQSGSGKTTMLNVIGGLDHFDSGDLLIDGISTREYRDRDWDAYRNNRIGFVFQSYNLIPHQTILSNVELALTLSGVSPAERKERARQALINVGLGDHIDKRPSQLSGGQMQRVAIARALINDPEILLADEPTGALDSNTSVQVMDLLREVAADRLVIMVTHNPELAQAYSTRIVELADGRIVADSDPFDPTVADVRPARAAVLTSMSFLTALSLSFNNLMTKKGRTLMTAFAGSIGIIGIAAILALANGVNAYIQEVEEETLSVYPLQIMSSGFDMTSMIVDVGDQQNDGEGASGGEGVADSDSKSQGGGGDSRSVAEARIVTNMFGRVGKNDLASLREYLDEDGGGIHSYVQDIEYRYGVVPQIYAEVTSDKVRQVNPDTSFQALGFGGSSSTLMASSSAFSTNVFSEAPSNRALFEYQFDVKAGRWPDSYDELVLVLSKSGKISDFMSYAMGLRDHKELEDMIQKFADQEEVHAPDDEREYTYDQLMGVTFRVVPASSLYEFEPEFNVWTSKKDDAEFMRSTVRDAQQLKIVGVVQAKEDVDATSLSQGIYYTPALTRWLMDRGAESKVVKEQIANPSLNVLSGKKFDQEANEEGSGLDMASLFSIDEEKLSDAFKMDGEGLDLSSMDFSGLGDSLDLSGLSGSMDLSNVSMPPLDLSNVQMPNVDPSTVKLDLSGVDLSGIDLKDVLTPEVTRVLSSALSRVDAQKVFEGVSPTIDYEKLQPAITEFTQGFYAYVATHPVNPSDQEAVTRLVGEYFSQPAVVNRATEVLRESVTFSEKDRQRIIQNILGEIQTLELTEEERNTLNAETQKFAQTASGQIIAQVANQMGEQVTSQMSGALATSLGGAMQTYMTQALTAIMTRMGSELQQQLGSAIASNLEGVMTQIMSNMADAVHIDADAFASAFQFNMSEQELGELLTALINSERTSYDNNLIKLGYADENKPSEIDIYPNNFDDKAQVVAILDEYNDRMREEDEGKVITYTDIVGVLMSSVTEIVNMISYVLIAFVAISLVVSSIMIGVITYISVLERKKEIGILRSIGASKRDVSNVFNAETVIEGLVSGIMGVGITALACIPANIIVEANFDVHRVARLPIVAAIVLVGVSVLLSFVAGVIPAAKAAKADPVEALRSE